MSSFSRSHMLLSFLLWCGVKLVLVNTGQTYKYDVEFISDTFATNCDEYPENTYDQFVDISGLNITIDDDGYLSTDGTIEFIRDLNAKTYSLRGEIFKRSRGIWENTVYSLERSDFCTAVFSANELWSDYFQNITAEERKCPMEKGQIINLSARTSEPLEFSDGSLSGEYKFQMETGDKGDDIFLCANVLVNLYRRD